MSLTCSWFWSWLTWLFCWKLSLGWLSSQSDSTGSKTDISWSDLADVFLFPNSRQTIIKRNTAFVIDKTITAIPLGETRYRPICWNDVVSSVVGWDGKSRKVDGSTDPISTVEHGAMEDTKPLSPSSVLMICLISKSKSAKKKAKF